MTRQRVLFFSPYAGLWPHAMPEALVAAALHDAGAEITYVTCNGLYARGCSVMAAHRLPANADQAARDRVCVECGKHRDLLTASLEGATIVPLESLISAADAAAAERLVAEVTPAAAADFEYDGLPLGRYALHETIIHFKLTTLAEMGPEAFADFRRHLRHVLLTCMAGKQMIERYSPQRLVAYNTHVSIMYTLMNFAERSGVQVYGVHAGGNMADRFSRLYVFRRDMVVLYQDMIRRFDEELGGVPATGEGIRNATEHFLALTSGRTVFVYSAPKTRARFDVRGHFGIGTRQRVVLATLSSYDELYSSQVMGVMQEYPLMFPTQVEWVKALIEWASKRPDLFLLIRVHPREFPNRRDPVHSAHAKALAAAFEKLPANVRINWPTDNVSLYDLATEVDVALNGWSSVGKELAMLGIPVVIYTKDILYYPASLNRLAADREDYFRRIEDALAQGWSSGQIRATYRWLAVEYTLATIDIGDGFNFAEGHRPSLPARVRNRLLRTFDPLHAQRSDTRALAKPLRHAARFADAILRDQPVVQLQQHRGQPLTPEAEGALLRSEMGRILAQVYPDPSYRDTPLIRNLHKFAAGAATAA